MVRHAGKLSLKKWIFSLLISPGLLFLFAYTTLYIAIHFFLTAYIKVKYSDSSFLADNKKYIFQFEDISINLWMNELRIKNCSFSFELPSSGYSQPPIQVYGKTPEVKLHDFTLFSLLHDQTISIHSFTVAKTQLAFSKSQETRSIEPAAVNVSSLPQFYFFPDSLSFSFAAENLRIRFSNLEHADDRPKVSIDASEIFAEVFPTTWHSFDNHFFLSSGNATYQHSNRTFALKNIELLPNQETLQNKYPIEEFHISLKSIELCETNPIELFLSHGIMARSINARGLNVKIKANWQDYVISNDVLLPNEAFQKLPFDVAIDSINIYDSEVSYLVSCRTKQIDKHIRFSGINASLTDIYKVNFNGIKNLPCHFSASCLLMGQTPFEVQATLPLLHPHFNVHFHGKIGELPASSLKLIANPKYAFTATRQSVDHIAFDVNINNGTAMGWINAICRGGEEPLNSLPNLPATCSMTQNQAAKRTTTQLALAKSKFAKTSKAGIIQARYSEQQGFLQFMWETIWSGLSQIFTA
ncbi:hypothetical protein Ctha_2496 [Chloroherpeton thalassium ATCC 35110]|uniref:AsmA-like C-terminal domain-containing protein n=1 Tax=Chloroherpeton thalassium (strain ATCC 35110 / GB-78) TaxID=517418 RepID=B3QXN0_CHLT3|nr:hypothetical protein [Chloroherpeton thalassium]ACF14945.1 hypothetical protein Ctha_2496 [Chloroherpeton thalassium ATCC 35110]